MFTNIRVGHTDSGLIVLEARQGYMSYRWYINQDEWNRFMCSRNINDIRNPVNRDVLEKLLSQIASHYWFTHLHEIVKYIKLFHFRSSQAHNRVVNWS